MKREDVQKLTALLGRAQRGDREAVNLVKRARARAATGDRRAQVVFNTLRVLHWMSREGKEKYARLEAFYGRCLHKDPSACAQLKGIVQRAKGGDEAALRTFRVLKSVHHKYKASAWSGPGEPKIGGYGMPNIHRAGIDIPGLGNIPVPYYPTPGINPQGGPPSSFLPLTPQAVAGLLQTIQQARMAPSPWQIPGLPLPSPGGDIFRSQNPYAMEDVPYAAPAPSTAQSTATTYRSLGSSVKASSPTPIRALSSSGPKPVHDYSGLVRPAVPCPSWDAAYAGGQAPVILDALRLRCEREAGYTRPMPYIR